MTEEFEGWKVDESTHDAPYRYIEESSWPTPLTECYGGYVSPENDLLLAIGELDFNESDNDSDSVQYGQDIGLIVDALPLWDSDAGYGQDIPMWVYRLGGDKESARETVRKIIQSFNSFETSPLSHGCISNVRPVTNDAMLSTTLGDDQIDYLLDGYVTHITWERKVPRRMTCYTGSQGQSNVEEIPDTCSEVTLHIVKREDGLLYPFHSFCPDHQVNALTNLPYTLLSNDRIDEINSKLNNGMDFTELPTDVWTEYFAWRDMYPIEQHFLIELKLNPVLFDDQRRLLRIIEPSVVDSFN